MWDDDQNLHWLDVEYQRYLDKGEFCYCNLPAHKCDCEHLTSCEFQEIELRQVEQYLCPTF